MRRAATLALFAATVGLYLVMVLWSLPKIAVAAGGLTPFDMRPGGYDFEAARAFLGALSDDGKRFYLGVQHRLDTLYPGLMALSLSVGLFWAWRDLSRWISVLFSAVAFAAAGFDYAENLRVAAMLGAGADGVTPDMVASASRASVGKAVLTSVAMVALLCGLVWRGWRRWRS